MLNRRTYLESRTVLGDSGEKTIDITPRAPITALWLEFRNTNGGTHNQLNTIAQNISAIEVVDGSDVLFSMDGEEALAWSSHFLGHIPNQLISEFPTNVQNLSIVIPFGRYIGDTEFAFDPRRYKNPQVRLKWDFATVNSVGASGFTTGTGRLSIVADVMEDAPTPRGFLMCKEVYTSAGAGSGDDYVDLPTDFPYAALMIRAYKAATAPYSVISQVKLEADGGRHIPFDMRMTDVIRCLGMSFPKMHYRHVFYLADGDTLRTILKYEEIIAGHISGTDDTVLRYDCEGYGEGIAYLDSAGSQQTSDVTVQAQVQGYCLYGHVFIPFGDILKPAEYFPVPSFKTLRLKLTQAVASATIAVCPIQLRMYGA